MGDSLDDEIARMTPDEALQWLRRHGRIVVFHKERTIVLRPVGRIRLHNKTHNEHLTVGCPFGCTLGYTETPVESLESLVEVVRETWREKVSAVDALADTVAGGGGQEVELRVNGTLSERYPGLDPEEPE